MRLSIVGLLLICVFQTKAQDELLQSGPMLGYSEMREVLLWVQTKSAADVHFTYYDLDARNVSFTTDTVLTNKDDAFVAKLVADKVLPGRVYHYTVHINGERVVLLYPTRFQTQQLWQWRHDPPDFKVATGSCFYVNDPQFDRPGRPYGRNFQVFEHIYEKSPDVMLWLGDNVYYREADWNTRTGMLYRNTHTRSQDYLQPLLANTHNYATWDDHDYGPNNSDGSWFRKETAREVFELFWGNITYGVEGVGGVTSQFQWADVDFFLLDNRSFRTANFRKTGEPQVLGSPQIEWLLNALKSSGATFKIIVVGGQVLNSATVHETYINLAPDERAYLLESIEKESIHNVIFLTGDRHITELSAMPREDGDTFYDLTVSPLTSGSWDNKEVNKYRADGTLVGEQNFALLHFEGPRKERTLKIEVFNADGELKWTRTIKAFRKSR